MIFSDLTSPAEAGFALGSGLWPARAQAPAGNRFQSMTTREWNMPARTGWRRNKFPFSAFRQTVRAHTGHAIA